MSSSVRQSNIFSAEDYKKVFKAYSFIDYTAYDFDTLKQALLNYIQTYYPEDFNDYVESSEFVAIVELLAYFGTSLAFRTDLNSRENFIDTAERRESVIRLAQMVNYVPKRNLAANGLFKITSVETNEPLVDANGIPIDNVSIFWNDPNNPDWFDQFIQICNAAFTPINPFGRPTKSGTIGSIPTDLYQLNSVTRLNVTYPANITVNGQQYPVDICNPDFITNQTIFERPPSPTNSFNFIYRNDSLGVSSPNTGFFLYFKQGNLLNVDANFEFPVANRIFPIEIQNINQTDVYVQETDENGDVINQWEKVPTLSGENVIYNSIEFAQRNIFEVISGANDTVTVRFPDGNFGNIPSGLFRFWVRISANENLVIRPDEAQGLQINIPYIGNDLLQYTLTVTFSLEQTVSNAATSETNEQIKLRAPEVFSTQSRMVNGSDYNVLPLVYGNEIAKLQALERIYSGQSRYLDLNDPTGFHRDLIIFGEDGALYRENQNALSQVVKNASNAVNIDSVLINTIEELLRDPVVIRFFYDEYFRQLEAVVRVNRSTNNPFGFSIFDLNPRVANQRKLFWKTSPQKFKNTTGYFTNAIDNNEAALLVTTLSPETSNGIYEPWGFIKNGAVLTMGKNTSVPVNSVIQNGLPLIINPLNSAENVGPVELGTEQQVNTQALKLYPPFRNTFNSVEIDEIVSSIQNGVSFWIYYDLLKDKWGTSTVSFTGGTEAFEQSFQYPPLINSGLADESIYSNWESNPRSGLIYVEIASNNEYFTTTYDITVRGRSYVFESYRDVRFYWEPGQVVLDSSTGQALADSIEIMPLVNTNSTINNNNPPEVIEYPNEAFLKNSVKFNLTGIFVQDDGYTDNSKIEVSLIDTNSDGISDNPIGFDEIVYSTDRIVFEYYSNEITGYQSTRPWVCKWAQQLQNEGGTLYIYFPINPADNGTLYSSPYISNTYFPENSPYILDPESAIVDYPNLKFVYMNDADLIFINSVSQFEFDDINVANINSLANQLTAFFNENVSNYPWLANTTTLSNKPEILTSYFLNKSFLIEPISPPGYGIYYRFVISNTGNLSTYSTGKIISSEIDKYHFDRNGKVFTQNTSIPEEKRFPFYFKWSHYAPIDQRVDPSVSNIIDMIVITYNYYRDMLIWKNNNGSAQMMPPPPTTEELRIQLQDLNQYKMLSDSMVWNSGKFKLLFGPQAERELQAIFKVVKSPTTNISDNEVKSRIIAAIDTYFDIRNWDFGEKFFYTELAAFIHQELVGIISSVVIVPSNSNSQFGNLFEILAGPTELFLSTATVNNVQIVTNYTEQNLRV